MRRTAFLCLPIWIGLRCAAAEPNVQQLPNTVPLTLQGDLSAQMVAGIDRFLLRETAESIQSRTNYWRRDFSSPQRYNESVQPNRERLAKILGVVDARQPVKAVELSAD